MNSVHFVTLGCSKNDVDTSVMQSLLLKDKYKVTLNIKDADIIIVNTCGFIGDAKEESIDTILKASLYKKNGNCKKLILAGCLAQRYSNELLEEIPEVDGIIGTGNLESINYVIENSSDKNKPILINNLNSDYVEGLKKENVKITEYIKISEGCNNNCSYCIIPKLRGKNRSRSIDNIYKEVEYLVSKGSKEIILIAQNTTDYGIDNYKKFMLHSLISKLSEIEELKWIRIMYLYPDNFTDELIEEFKNNNKLLKYVDIPLQHVSDNVLNNMNRKTDKNHIKRLLKTLRSEVKDIVIRTTFIVGFPGETDSDFNELVEFIKENKFDKLGAFTYSLEENTKAYSMKNQIDDNVKKERLDKLMSVQKEISDSLMENSIGKILTVLVEEKIDDLTYSGRSFMDSPEIDGVVYINSIKNLEINDFVNVKITDSLEYDLIGEYYESSK